MKTDNDGTPEDPETPRSNSSFFSSFDSKYSTRSLHTRPTILKVGMISGMKTKGSKLFSAQKVSYTVPPTPDSMDSSFFSSMSPAADTSVVEDEYECTDHDCVEHKLDEALRLKTARNLGMAKDSLTLANYSKKGEQFIVKELVKSILNRATMSSEGGCTEMVDEIRSYAATVNASFDEAVQQVATDLCDTNRNIPDALQQAETLSRWCSSPSLRCLIVLKMLQKARASSQRPPDLNPLAKEAISWATDGNVKAELKEETRLLAIDSLVRKYCGNGAQEFFRVTEPQHGLRLVQHVCRHIDVPTVLADLLMLCDGFNHVSRLDTCVSLLQRVMTASRKVKRGGDTIEINRVDQCSLILRELYSKDALLAERVGERIAGFCAQTLEDCKKLILQDSFSDEAKRQAMEASSTACSVLSVMQDQVTARQAGCTGFEAPSFQPEASKLLKEFQKISQLQSGCGIFLVLDDLRDPAACASVQLDLLKPCIDLLSSQNETSLLEDDSLRQQLKPMMAMARHWCAILCDIPSRVSQVWSRAVGIAASRLAKKAGTYASLILLEVSGVLDERNGHSAFHSIMSVALSLCSRAFFEARNLSKSMPHLPTDDGDSSSLLIAMKSIAQASLLLREHGILFSPPSMLSPALSLGNLTELVCELSIRSDLGVGERLEKYLNAMHNGGRKNRLHLDKNPSKSSVRIFEGKGLPSSPNLHPTWYIGDGLLLRPLEALTFSMSYCKTIMGIESMPFENGHSIDQSMRTSETFHALESRGAHTITLRLATLSTAISMSQSCSLDSAVPMLYHAENILKKNKRVLAERSLGGTASGLTSGKIDSLLAISYLIHLPKEMAFKVRQYCTKCSFALFARIETKHVSFVHRFTKRRFHRRWGREISTVSSHLPVLAHIVEWARILLVDLFHGTNKSVLLISVMSYL